MPVGTGTGGQVPPAAGCVSGAVWQQPGRHGVHPLVKGRVCR